MPNPPESLQELLNSSKEKNLLGLISTLSKQDFSTLFLKFPEELQEKALSKIMPYLKNYEILTQNLEVFQSYRPEDKRKIIEVTYDTLLKELAQSKKNSKEL
jgi:ribosomal protein L13